MKLAPLILVVWLATLGAAIGATRDTRFSTHDDSTAVPGKGGSADPGGPEVGGYRRGWLEDAVEIVSVTEGKPNATGERKVTVRVRYALVHYANGMLALAFNLKAPTTFVQVATQPVRHGSEIAELSATIIPATWPKPQAFKVYVGMSAEARHGQTSLLATASQPMRPVAPPAPAR